MNKLDNNKEVKKPWGKEIWYAQVPKKYLGKVLHINRGARTSLHHHEKKEETLYVWSGPLVYRWVNKAGKEQQKYYAFNEVVHVKPGTKHSLGAGSQRVILFEVSTCHPDDSIRDKDYYGRKCGG